ncbi:MAG TPA: hypothetical protein PKE39_04310 [Ignavibacteria bacterium]|nr:hypothetical protein [Ignavibacteria bacterium]
MEYTTESLKDMAAEQLKELLAVNEISTRNIAAALDVNHSIVVCTINGNYKGAKATSNKVYQQIAKMLEVREDLSDDIYNNAAMFSRLLNIGIKHKSFDNNETAVLITIANTINKFIEHQNNNHE